MSATVQFQNGLDENGIFQCGGIAIGGQPLNKFYFIVFETADDHIAVSDICGQNHFDYLPSIFAAWRPLPRTPLIKVEASISTIALTPTRAQRVTMTLLPPIRLWT